MSEDDDKLVQDLLNSLRKEDPTADIPKNLLTKTTSEDKLKNKPELKIRGGQQDGDRSPNTGPCACGYKHYLEGKEYDYVFQIGTSAGPKKIGYNQDDNPFDVAQNFLIRNKLNEKSLNDTPYISAIANAIIENTNNNRNPSAVEKELEQARAEEEGSFDPFKPSWNVPKSGTVYNKQTEKFETTIYPPEQKKIHEDLEKKRKEQTDEQRKKLQEQKLHEEIEKQKIKDRIRLDKLEREAQKRVELEKKAAASQQSQYVIENGVVKPSKSNEDLASIINENKSFKPYDDSDDSDDEFGMYKPNRSTSKDKISNQAGKQKGFMTLSDMSSKADNDTSPVFDSRPKHSAPMSVGQMNSSQPIRKSDWTMPMMMNKYKQGGTDSLIKALKSSGFANEEITNLVRIVTLLALQQLTNNDMDEEKEEEIEIDQHRNGNGFKAFQGHGQSLTPSTSTENFQFEMDIPPKSPRADLAPQPTFELKLDSTQPVTSIQIRLHNGEKLVAQFNHTHTVMDIRMYIESQSKMFGLQYDIMTTFPRKVLSDHSQSIAKAGLVNAVIVQTLIK